MTVTAEINIESPTGRRIVRELETHKKVVKLHYPEPVEINAIAQKTYSLDEAFENLENRLKEHYGIE